MEGLLNCPFCGSGWHRKEFGVFILWHEPTCVFGGPNGVVHSTTMDELFAIKWNTRATDPLMEKMAEALERIDQWDWNAILQYSECDKEVFEDLGNVGAALQEYRERKDAK